MNKRLLRVIATLAVSLLLPATLGLPAYAESGSGSGTSSGSGSGSNETETSETTETEKPETNDTAEVKTPLTDAQKERLKLLTSDTETMLKGKGKKALAEAKKESKEHTAEERLKNCNKNKTGMQSKINNLKSNSAKHLAKIDSVLAKVTTAQAATPTDGVDTLLTSAVAAQTTATTSVAALGNLVTTIDCTSDSVASNIATIKAAADQARTDLKAYRVAVKAVLKTIETASDAKKEDN